MTRPSDEFDDDPTPVDPTPEIIDEDAESLAINGPADSAREVTPTILDPCSECGGALVRVANWIHQPTTPEDVWRHWGKHCVATQSNDWAWCPKSGWFTGRFDGRMRVYWERRRVRREPTR